ncbi:MAG: hypothetical protein ACFE8M_11575 [Candidatus Hermodarchaeota archaeon]
MSFNKKDYFSNSYLHDFKILIAISAKIVTQFEYKPILKEELSLLKELISHLRVKS